MSDKETFNPGDYPAFPMYNELGNLHAEGLTKREYFAAMAMPVVFKYCLDHEISKPFETAAKDAVEMADALLQQLNDNQ